MNNLMKIDYLGKPITEPVREQKEEEKMDITTKVKPNDHRRKTSYMELIWDDLCHTSDFSSPNWHKI